MLLFLTVSSVKCELKNRLMVATGYNEDGSLADAEIVQVGTDDSCSKEIADYPLFIRGTAGGLVDGKLVVCGGGYFLFYSEDCYQYDPEANGWIEVRAEDYA